MGKRSKERMGWTDFHVLNAAKKHPGDTMIQLLGACQEEKSAWNWTTSKVRKSLRRLEREGKLRIEDRDAGVFQKVYPIE
jgi:hypothetical protein